MGKDSGLPTYAEFGDREVFGGHSYSDLASPDVRDKDYEAFKGFWEQCEVDYGKATPHKGYSILNDWVSERFFFSCAMYFF